MARRIEILVEQVGAAVDVPQVNGAERGDCRQLAFVLVAMDPGGACTPRGKEAPQ